MAAVEMIGVSKSGFEAQLNDLTFSAEEGEITCLIGPSGAGKHMVVEIMAGLTRPDVGRVRVFGQDPFASNQLSRRCCYVMRSVQMPGHLYLDDFLLHASRSFGFSEEDARRALRLLGLWAVRHTRIRKLTHQQRSMSKFLVPVCRQSDLLVVDGMERELDEGDLEFVYSCLFDIVRQDHKTLLITSSGRGSVENFADTFLEMENGIVSRELSAMRLIRSGVLTLCRIRVSDVIGASRLLNVLSVEGNSVIIREPSGGLSAVLAVLESKGIRIIGVDRIGEEGEIGSQAPVRGG